MRTHRTLAALTTIAAAAAVAGLAMPGAHAAADPGSGKAKPGGGHVAHGPAADAAASATAVSPAATAALGTVQTKIADYVAQHGTRYTFGSYVDPATGTVVVQTNAPAKVVASVTALPASADGRGEVRVSVQSQGISDDFSRRDDTPAFYAGGGIASGGAICSSSYPVKNSAGTRFMVTAGHCFANGAAVTTESGANSYGTVTGRALASLGSGPIDMELMTGASYAARLFTGGVTSSTSMPIVGAGNAVVGFNNYCHSGRTTGTNCGHTATSTTGQVCTSTGCKSPVIVFTGGVMIQPGDSGGSFYALSGDGASAFIRGHVIASGGGTGYAEPYSQVAARYGVTIAN